MLGYSSALWLNYAYASFISFPVFLNQRFKKNPVSSSRVILLQILVKLLIWYVYVYTHIF